MEKYVPIVNYSLKYIFSIDELSIIALSLVLPFYTLQDYFSFGYIWVDIIFVFFGYLITQIIYTKIEEKEFSFKEFHRIRKIFLLDCKLKYKDYIEKSGEYRNFIYNLAKRYNNVTLIDPKDLYYDSEYYYAIKNAKMFYSHDNQHSVDGSIEQAKYLMNNLFFINKSNNVK